MRILGLDFGTKYVGIAVSDETMIIAQPLDTLIRKSLQHDLIRIANLISKHEIGKIIVGIPFNMDGSQGPSAEKALEFASLIQEHLKIQVEMWDERLSSYEAEQSIIQAGGAKRNKRKNIINKVAASLILQSYLDTKK